MLPFTCIIHISQHSTPTVSIIPIQPNWSIRYIVTIRPLDPNHFFGYISLLPFQTNPTQLVVLLHCNQSTTCSNPSKQCTFHLFLSKQSHQNNLVDLLQCHHLITWTNFLLCIFHLSFAISIDKNIRPTSSNNKHSSYIYLVDPLQCHQSTTYFKLLP